ncbi:MAG: radical SAM family heme chaperone HemW [Thermodesulfobacteriota bacterium]
MNLGIYIHLPYCLTKCPYCDFNSYGVGDIFPEEEYTSAILNEIDQYSGYLSGNSVSTVFFGGGTPSLFKPENINKMIKKIADNTRIEEDAEISIEINPKTANSEKISKFKEIGINRASVGIQSFSERKLKFYGRLNSPEEGKEILRHISEAGYKNFNVDLIYGSTNESFEELESDIDISLEFNPTHLSAYCLTIEDGTQFGKLYDRGLLRLPEDKVLSEMYNITTDLLTKRGFHHYEISNFCEPDFECRHNLIYWECDSYIGFGAGAHSHLTNRDDSPWGIRWANLKNPNNYIESIKNKRTVHEFTERLTREESVTDRLLMGLRLKKGINIKQLETSCKTEFDPCKLKNFFDDGMIEIVDGNLKITEKGRIFSNELIYKAVNSFALLN